MKPDETQGYRPVESEGQMEGDEPMSVDVCYDPLVFFVNVAEYSSRWGALSSSTVHYRTKPGHFETSKIHFPTSEGVSEVNERANK